MIVTTKLELYISNYSNVDYQYEVMRKNEVCNYRVPGWDFILATALRLEENLLTSWIPATYFRNETISQESAVVYGEDLVLIRCSVNGKLLLLE